MDLLDLAFTELTRSNADKRHPFRTMVLGTHSEYPEQRTVVKRAFDKNNSIIFYTDSRTPKCKQINSNAKVSLLFYHPKKKLQLRIKGIANIIDKNSEVYKKHLDHIKNTPSLSDYQSKMIPGSILESKTIEFQDTIHLTVVEVLIKEIDIVSLRSEGHLRCSYTLDKDQWLGSSLVP